MRASKEKVSRFLFLFFVYLYCDFFVLDLLYDSFISIELSC